MATTTVPGAGEYHHNVDLSGLFYGDDDIFDLTSRSLSSLTEFNRMEMIGGTGQSAYEKISGDTLFGAYLTTGKEQTTINFAPSASKYTQELNMNDSIKGVVTIHDTKSSFKAEEIPMPTNPLDHVTYASIQFVDSHHLSHHAVSFPNHHGAINQESCNHAINFVNIDDDQITSL